MIYKILFSIEYYCKVTKARARRKWWFKNSDELSAKYGLWNRYVTIWCQQIRSYAQISYSRTARRLLYVAGLKGTKPFSEHLLKLVRTSELLSYILFEIKIGLQRVGKFSFEMKLGLVQNIQWWEYNESHTRGSWYISVRIPFGSGSVIL